MNSHARWLPYIAIFTGLVIFPPFLFVVIFLPTYSSIALAIIFFLSGFISLFAGIKQRTTLTRAETSSVWWKNCFIMLALAQESWGVLVLTSSKNMRNHVNETIVSSIGVPALILSLGLGIYAIVLLIRYITSNGKPS